MKLELANRSILNCLELAAAKGKFIRTGKNQRNIGKTTALIEFAKENDLIVMVPNDTIAKYYVKQYGYRRIKGINSRVMDGIGPWVFEEGCDIYKVNQLVEQGHIVITGYVLGY